MKQKLKVLLLHIDMCIYLVSCSPSMLGPSEQKKGTHSEGVWIFRKQHQNFLPMDILFLSVGNEGKKVMMEGEEDEKIKVYFLKYDDFYLFSYIVHPSI